MEEFLKKYYEYFNKKYPKVGMNFDYTKEFNNLYNIIIGSNHKNELKQTRIDIEEFFEFFDSIDYFGDREKGYYSPNFNSKILALSKSKAKFLLNSPASFNWFNPTEYMVKNDDFVYSINATSGYFCKAYLSIKPEKYVDVIIQLQRFIDKLYKSHPNEAIGQCKFRNFTANDSIVMRFASEEHYNEFLKFLEQNRDITDAFDKPNIFLPQDKYGISVIPDTGGSYNYFVTKMIFDYIICCRKYMAEVSIPGIVCYINFYDCSKDRELCRNEIKVINDFKSILIGKLNSIPNEELLTYVFDKKVKTLNLKIKNS